MFQSEKVSTFANSQDLCQKDKHNEFVNISISNFKTNKQPGKRKEQAAAPEQRLTQGGKPAHITIAVRKAGAQVTAANVGFAAERGAVEVVVTPDWAGPAISGCICYLSVRANKSGLVPARTAATPLPPNIQFYKQYLPANLPAHNTCYTANLLTEPYNMRIRLLANKSGPSSGSCGCSMSDTGEV